MAEKKGKGRITETLLRGTLFTHAHTKGAANAFSQHKRAVYRLVDYQHYHL